MNADKLSTGGASPSAESKKREGEKRKSPLTPYRGKGKEKGKRENLMRKILRHNEGGVMVSVRRNVSDIWLHWARRDIYAEAIVAVLYCLCWGVWR